MNEHAKIAHGDLHGYDADFHAWTVAQTATLRAGRLREVDLEHVAEEIESLGKSQHAALKSHFVIALEHLLKLAHSDDQPPRRVWKLSVVNTRNHIEDIFEQSPSLRGRRAEIFDAAWPHAVRAAALGVEAREEQMLKAAGAKRPFTIDQLLDPDFFPGD